MYNENFWSKEGFYNLEQRPNNGRSNPGANALDYPIRFAQRLIAFELIKQKGMPSLRSLIAAILTNDETYRVFKLVWFPKEAKQKEPKPAAPGKKQRQVIRRADQLEKILGVKIPDEIRNREVRIDDFLRKIWNLTSAHHTHSRVVQFLDAQGNPVDYKSIFRQTNPKQDIFLKITNHGQSTHKRLLAMYERFDPFVKAGFDWEKIVALRSGVMFMKTKENFRHDILSEEVTAYNFWLRYFSMVSMYCVTQRGETYNDDSIQNIVAEFGIHVSKNRGDVDRMNLKYQTINWEEERIDHITIPFSTMKVVDGIREGYGFNHDGVKFFKRIHENYINYIDIYERLRSLGEESA